MVEAEPTIQKRTAEVLFNPNAGGGIRVEQAKLVQARLIIHGIHVGLRQTERRGHAIDLAHKAAANGVELVLVLGGDGTLNEAVNGLSGTETALGCVPVGTTNNFGREIGTPFDVERAVDAFIFGEDRRTDVISVMWAGGEKERKALQAVGFGYDGRVFNGVQPPDEVRKGNGQRLYFQQMLRQLSNADTPRGIVRVDGGKAIEFDHFTQGWLGNTRALLHVRGRRIILRPNAKVDDGRLEFTGYDGRYGNPQLDTLSTGVRVLSDAIWPGRQSHHEIRKQGTIFEFEFDRPVYLQGDGDAWAESTHVVAAVLTGALRKRVPRQGEATVYSLAGVQRR